MAGRIYPDPKPMGNFFSTPTLSLSLSSTPKKELPDPSPNGTGNRVPRRGRGQLTSLIKLEQLINIVEVDGCDLEMGLMDRINGFI